MARLAKVRAFGRIALLCAVGGSADAVAYLRYGTFVGAMTGNTVLLSIDLVAWRPERALFHGCIVAVFLLAIVLTRVALLSRFSVSVLLALAGILLGVSGLIGSEWSTAIAAAALGVQNAAVRRIGGVSINTAFITGDLLRLGSAVPQAGAPKSENEVALLAAAWIAYATGAVIGAAALHFTIHAMAVPAVLALLAAALPW
jgi:uncharacterized membrane protein YoaK (UPF0700 family)